MKPFNWTAFVVELAATALVAYIQSEISKSTDDRRKD